MTTHDLSSATWRTSSYTDGNGGACVEVADGITEVVPVRDTKNRGGGTLLFPAAAWSPFIVGLKEESQ